MAYYYRDATILPEETEGSSAWITELRSFLLHASLLWEENIWSHESGTGSAKAAGTIQITNNTFNTGDYVTITDVHGDAYAFVPSTSTATPANRTGFTVGALVADTATNLGIAIQAHRALGVQFSVSVDVGTATVTLTARVGGVQYNSCTIVETDGATNNFTVVTFASGTDAGPNADLLMVKTPGSTPVTFVMASSNAYAVFGYSTKAAFVTAVGHFVILAVPPNAVADNGWNDDAPHWSALLPIFSGRSQPDLIGIRSWGSVRMCANEDRLFLAVQGYETLTSSSYTGVSDQIVESIYAGYVAPSDSSDDGNAVVMKNVPIESAQVPSNLSPYILESGLPANLYYDKVAGFPGVINKASPAWANTYAVDVVGHTWSMLNKALLSGMIDRIPAYGQKIPYSLHSSPADANKVDMLVLLNDPIKQEMFALVGVGLGTNGLPSMHTVTISAVTWMFWPSSRMGGDMLLIAIGTAI